MSDRFQSYSKFWPFYLGEHSKPATRNLHVMGTLGGLLAGAAAIITQTWWLPLAGLGFAYAAAWTSHAFIEKNKPATFKYPAWSFISDFRMLGFWSLGKLKKEFNKHGLDYGKKKPAPAPQPPKAQIQAPSP
jgi:hypothetical protein